MASNQFNQEYSLYSVLDYLKRKPCLKCRISDTGVLEHCSDCQKLYDTALACAAELVTKPSYEHKKQLEAQIIVEQSKMKKSHTWVASQEYLDSGKTRMAPYTSHCIKCGAHHINFKLKPFFCPKKAK